MCTESRRYGSRALVGALLLAVLASPARALPDIQSWSTANGARVLFVAARELPMIDLQVLFAAGSAFEPAGRGGVALLTASLLGESADGMDADAISYEFERLGAVFAPQSGVDSTQLSLRSLSDRRLFDAALVNFERVMARPAFPAPALERQRNRLLVGIRQKQQDPGALAQDAFAAALYGEHPYGRPTEGTEDSVRTITRDDLVAFHHEFYTAKNALIAIVGDLDRRAAQRIADRLSRALPRGAAAPELAPVNGLAAAREIRIAHPSSQSHVLVGQPGMRQNDPDYFALYVGNHILGGGGLVSRLFEEVREKRGLSYAAYSGFSARFQSGPFVAGLQTRADQTDAALAVLRETLARFVVEGPDETELADAKRNLTGGFPLRIDSNGKILAFVASIGFYGLPLDWLETYTARVDAVSAGQIRDAFRRRIDPQRMVTVIAGPDGGGAPGD
jgi:zinc protease